jgi:hypothetical protein
MGVALVVYFGGVGGTDGIWTRHFMDTIGESLTSE